MASHDGLVYTIKTEKGYIAENNTYTDKVDKALRISFERFGWTEASNVLQKLGFPKEEAKYVTLEPSYDTRLGVMEDYAILLGYRYPDNHDMARRYFSNYDSCNYNNYVRCINDLKDRVECTYNRKKTVDTISVNGKTIELKEFENAKTRANMEYRVDELYGDMRQINKTTFRLKKIPIDKYYTLDENEVSYYTSYNDGIKDYVLNEVSRDSILDIKLVNNELIVYSFNPFNYEILDAIRSYYEKNEVHITRMFGSYILLEKQNGILRATKATPIPIKYCPLMIKLLKEVGGQTAETLLETLNVEDEDLQTEMMCNLINEVVIKGGYFNTSRPLNSCEANVLFGASETIASSFNANLVDAAVIVSNNLGTIITTNASNTQGAVKRMTGLFYTSPSSNMMKIAKEASIIPIFPYTAEIDQLAGVEKAIALGYKRIAVSVAANDNCLHQKLRELEIQNNVVIYKFGLCSTGIDDEKANIMSEYADIVWSCASKAVKENIEPKAIAQVGVKIPVHIMTKNGWLLIKNHLEHLKNNIDFNNVELQEGENKPVFINEKDNIKVLSKKDIHNCLDCPHPCI